LIINTIVNNIIYYIVFIINDNFQILKISLYHSHSNENIPSIEPNYKQSLYLRKITKTEIIKIITYMRGDSSPGIDGISINLIKKNIRTNI